MESSTFRARIMNYNQLVYKATMYFEWQTDFGRWVKISCITMFFFIVSLYTFSCNVKKWLSFNTISLNIFDRIPVLSTALRFLRTSFTEISEIVLLNMC